MKQKPLGSFELFVMMSLSRLGRDAYGMLVRQDLQERLGRNYSIGAVYQTLERLEKKGFLKSHRGPPEATRGGRPRRFFEITGTGQQVQALTIGDIELMKTRAAGSSGEGLANA